jgi:hypothetical protein
MAASESLATRALQINGWHGRLAPWLFARSFSQGARGTTEAVPPCLGPVIMYA